VHLGTSPLHSKSGTVPQVVSASSDSGHDTGVREADDKVVWGGTGVIYEHGRGGNEGVGWRLEGGPGWNCKSSSSSASLSLLLITLSIVSENVPH
jgi:hypothetical protein